MNEFERAAGFMSSGRCQVSLSTDQQLELYAHFKQAKEGDCKAREGGFWGLMDMTARAKRGAWDKLAGMPKLDAAAGYVAFVDKLQPGWRDAGEGGGEDGAARSTGGTGMGISVSTMAAAANENGDCAWTDEEALLAAASEGNRKALHSLVLGGAPLDQKDGEGRTSLHYAADRGHLAVVQELLSQAGARHGAGGMEEFLNCRDSDGLTALHNAVLCGHAEIVKALVEARADASILDADGDSALSVADPDIKPLLLKGLT